MSSIGRVDYCPEAKFCYNKASCAIFIYSWAFALINHFSRAVINLIRDKNERILDIFHINTKNDTKRKVSVSYAGSQRHGLWTGANFEALKRTLFFIRRCLIAFVFAKQFTKKEAILLHSRKLKEGVIKKEKMYRSISLFDFSVCDISHVQGWPTKSITSPLKLGYVLIWAKK